jgi:hypothetical protein
MRFPRFFGWFAQRSARIAQLAIMLVPGCMAEGGAVDERHLRDLDEDASVQDPSNPPSSTPTTPSGSGDGVPCAVSTILEQKCNSCHGATPKYGAPMALATYGDLHAATPSKPERKVFQEVAARVHDDARPMPQAPNPRLNATELATLDAWVKSGAPRGETCRDGTTPSTPPAETPLGCTPDVNAKPGTPYTMPATEKDVYTCYGFDQTVSSKRHATAFRIKVDNAKIVHHVLLFQSDKAVSSTPQPCAATALAGWRMVYGWSPGSKGRELPAEAGIPIEGTTHWVVQVHYNNSKGYSGEKDSTGFEMCTTDSLRKYDADMLVWGTRDISIAPKSKLDLSCSFKPSSIWMPAIHIVSGSPHMHGRGRSFTTTLKKKDGRTIDLGSTAAFDWGNQQSYPVAPDTIVEPDDTVVTRCVFENTGSSTVQWGEGTDDEMCFNFTMYYPKIKASLWSWVAPALFSSCTR